MNEVPLKPSTEQKRPSPSGVFEKILRNTGIMKFVAVLMVTAGSASAIDTNVPDPFFKKAGAQAPAPDRLQGRGLKHQENISTTNESHAADIYNRFIKIDENGNPRLNLGAILAQAQIELGKTTDRKALATFEVPYEYSRFFNSATPLNADDRKKVEDFLEQRIKQELANVLTFIDFSDNSKDVYRAHHRSQGDDQEGLLNTTKINSIKIKGFASPEGPASKGPSTIRPGVVDKENLALGTKRANDIQPLLLQALERLGVQPTALAEIHGEELQFSSADLTQLKALADDLGVEGDNPEEVVWNLVRAYNTDTFVNNASAQERLNAIIGNKRHVEVTIEYQNSQSKKLIVPLPLLLLALVAWPRTRRRTETPSPQEPGVFPDDVVTFTQNLPVNDPNFVERFNSVPLPTAEIDRAIIEERVFLDDITRYMDDSWTHTRGLNYRKMINDLHPVLERYTPEQQEQAVTHVVLTRWKEHDMEARRQIKVSSMDGLDYHQQDRQILWARFHAQELIRLANVPTPSLDDHIRARVATLRVRRLSRIEEIPPTPRPSV